MPVGSRVRTEAPFLADNKLYTYNSHDRRRSLWQLQSSSSSSSGDSSSSPPTPISTSKAASRFGRQDYWDDFYRDNSQFSWYTGWDDLEPFLREYLQTSDRILLPGVGNDAMLRDMYDAGYQTLTAFDYAPEGIARCRDMLGDERIFVSNADDGDDNSSTSKGVKLFVGDARNLLQLPDESFDIVLEKGALDAIVQSGGGISEKEKALGLQNMQEAVEELTRVLKPGGLFISISAIWTSRLEASPLLANDNEWEVVRDGSLYLTEDGYASNNFDGTLLAWRKR